MNILKLEKTGIASSEAKKQLLARHNIYVTAIVPTLLSAITSLKIRTAIDKGNYDAILVTNFKEAIAAISARHLAKKKNIKIIYKVVPNSQPPKGIPSDIRQGVDGWIFPSQRQQSLYPSGLSRTIVIPDADFDDIAESKISDNDANKDTYLWIGSIDGNTSALIAAIEAIDTLPGNPKLVICGTGKAQQAMPAVRHSRVISHPEVIVWKGDDFDLGELSKQTYAIIQAGHDPIGLELAFAANGKKLMHPSDIANNTNISADKAPNREEICDKISCFIYEITHQS